MDTKKIVLIGDAQVGKTTLIRLLMSREYKDKYSPTLGVEVHPIRRGNKCYNMWDCAGDPRYVGLKDGYWIQADGAIVMCDTSNPTSIQSVARWARDFRRIQPDATIVIVVNKTDLHPIPIEPANCVVISCKNREGIEEILSCFD